MKLVINGINDLCMMTGTGIRANYACEVTGQDPSPGPFWRAAIKKVEVLVGGDTRKAQLFPLEGVDPIGATTLNFARDFRFDSTVSTPSASGTPMPITLKCTFLCVQWGWVMSYPPYFGPIAADEVPVELTATPTAFNVGLANATSAAITPSPPPVSGWQDVYLPEEYLWHAVSQDMAAAANTALSSAGYANLAGNLHDKVDLVLPVPPPGQPPGDRLTKLIGQSTAYFNSSHGTTGGVSDQTAQTSNWVTWSDVSRTSGNHVLRENERDLSNRIVWLYSCQCGQQGGTFHAPLQNGAAFGFSQSVLSSLTSGNALPNQPYNDASGNLLMTDKLSLHVDKLLQDMASGIRAADALAAANQAFPPRKFRNGVNGVNFTDVLNLQMSGDPYTTLHTVFRSATETDANSKRFGDAGAYWGIVFWESIS